MAWQTWSSFKDLYVDMSPVPVGEGGLYALALREDSEHGVLRYIGQTSNLHKHLWGYICTCFSLALPGQLERLQVTWAPIKTINTKSGFELNVRERPTSRTNELSQLESILIAEFGPRGNERTLERDIVWAEKLRNSKVRTVHVADQLHEQLEVLCKWPLPAVK